ncbi:Rcs stress response system protein RcsF [Idiomarina sp. HP20-50]|uniref:Rcs stress response system protein RcsF n=1 Tax=Idiomarina sp. HP20-50 TaxID=3070813 RepID=UPI00294B45BB|nr:Rcs stress response system protein RcsF [Idiomarina sp. HP20-50]MDV6315114.1 hypothetical protein [Idiomarina sp. HP20-50]
MRSAKLSSVFLLSLVVFGCKSFPDGSLFPESYKASYVRQLDDYQLSGTGAEALGITSASDCQSESDNQPASRQQAFERLKAKVYNLGGNIVVLSSCHDTVNNQCQSSVSCIGGAYFIPWQNQPGNNRRAF